ncbi:MAG: hypothetical protein OXE45_12905, partial [bacterium]|nr:hypothetical protein [bacterium]
MAVPVAVSVTDTAVVAAVSNVAVTVTDPPPSATVSLLAFVVNVKADGCAAVAVTVTDTEATVSPLYCVSSLVAAWVIVEVPASTPVTVKVFGVFQFDGVNV